MKAINLGYINKSVLRKLVVIVTIFAVAFFYAAAIKEFFGFLAAFDRRILISQKKWWMEMLCKKYNPELSIRQSLKLERFLVDVFPEKVQLNNIYMIQSDCSFKLSERFLCGAESAARYNPSATVYFLTFNHFVDNQRGSLRSFLRKVPNLKVVVADLDLLLKNTQLATFNNTKKWTNIEEYKLFDVLDSIRLALIYRFGGTYLDADILLLKTLPEEANVVVKDSNEEIWSAFLKAESHNVALEMAIATMASQYNGSTWGAIGNKILGETLSRYEKDAKAEGDPSDDFHVLEYHKYQPILPDDSNKIFETNFNFTELDSLLNDSYGIHLSNDITKHLEADLGSASLIESLAKKHCPIIYQEMFKNKLI